QLRVRQRGEHRCATAGQVRVDVREVQQVARALDAERRLADGEREDPALEAHAVANVARSHAPSTPKIPGRDTRGGGGTEPSTTIMRGGASLGRSNSTVGSRRRRASSYTTSSKSRGVSPSTSSVMPARRPRRPFSSTSPPCSFRKGRLCAIWKPASLR